MTMARAAWLLPLARALVCVLGAVGASVASPGASEASPDSDRCVQYDRPQRSGDVPEALHEMSGLAASRLHDGVFWAHNDSGNDFELFAIDATGRILARIPLEGARARDIEDVAVGPCRAGASESCIYLGDVGDNRYRHREARIYRMPEPPTLDERPRAVDVLPFRWPDRPHNVEAIAVDPRSGAVFLWTKEPNSLGIVYRLEGLRPGGTAAAHRIREIDPDAAGAGLTTGVDVHPSGERILLRTYGQLWELRRPGATRVEDVLEAKPEPLPTRRQPQSEAVAYSRDGRGYLVGTEGAGGPLYAAGCAPPPETGSSRSSS